MPKAGSEIDEQPLDDTVGRTLTVRLDDPGKEHVCEETTGEVVLMKEAGLAIETVVRTGV